MLPSPDHDAPAAAAPAQALRVMLHEARARTLALASDLTGEQLLGPRLEIVNPPLWEIGHLGWFQERWCVRQRIDGTLGPSILGGADALYDSSKVAHATRWDLPLPTLEATLDYLDAVLQRTCERLTGSPSSMRVRYFAQLAAAHEEMHCEAFTYVRQTLGYPCPADLAPLGSRGGDGACVGDVEIPGGAFMLGATRDDGFVFDNEKWAHPVRVAPFSIARAPVTNASFAAFVEDGGYKRADLWSPSGWTWRTCSSAQAPVYWHREDGAWLERVFDRLAPLAPHLPVAHVNWYEADAYCRWAGRRLPTEAEWEMAASADSSKARSTHYPWGPREPDASRANLYGVNRGRVDVSACAGGDSAWGCRQMIGNVWEWTADPFAPYPGFVADPYADYSQPWFGDHMVLKGGAYATRAHLIRNTWRNFYKPDRRDVFAGFRTCAQ